MSDTTREPLFWCCSGPGIQSFHDSKADAEEYREHSGIADEVEVFQVGRAFALTDAEREATEYPATWQDECADVENAFARSGVRPTWPDDEPGNIGPMAAAMADEIARLRLSDAEREAIASAMDIAEAVGRPDLRGTLRNLLARLGGDK